mgnify:FL=1
MIQDIFPHRFYNTYQQKRPEDNSRILGFCDRMVYLSDQDGIRFLTFQEWKSYNQRIGRGMPPLVYLFTIEEEDYFLTDIHKEDKIGEFRFYKMFDIRPMQPKEAVFAATTAFHLYQWYRDNQFCGRCGKKLIHSEKLRMMQCETCNNMVFPKIAPAVIVGVTNDDRILMTKYAGREYKRYALIAGFTEIGETVEETVQREVMEEVGLKVKNIRYYKSQPWGFDSNLLLGFFCELADEHEICLDREELSLAEWVDYHDILDDPEKLSLTHNMMEYFRDQKKAGVWNIDAVSQR